jgi:glycosyltransferase involved in cell wall biosynthesis
LDSQHKISVIIPTYKRPEKLQRALLSVFNQALQPLEIIVIDNNTFDSKDFQQSRDVIERFANNKIKYFSLGKNMGPSYARNYGVEMSNGALLCFMDDDVVWEPDKLEKQYICIGDNEACLTASKHLRDGKIIKEFRNKNHFVTLKDLKKGGKVGGELSTFMVRKSVFEKYQFDENAWISEDNLFFAKLLNNGIKISFLDETLTTFFEEGHDKLNKTNNESSIDYIKKHTRLNIETRNQIGSYYPYYIARAYIGSNMSIKQLKAKRIIEAIKKAGIWVVIKVLWWKFKHFVKG